MKIIWIKFEIKLFCKNQLEKKLKATVINVRATSKYMHLWTKICGSLAWVLLKLSTRGAIVSHADGEFRQATSKDTPNIFCAFSTEGKFLLEFAILKKMKLSTIDFFVCKILLLWERCYMLIGFDAIVTKSEQ